jgi:hypothetical protein
VKNEDRFANMNLLQNLVIDTQSEGISVPQKLFKKWNKDKLMTFYNHQDFKLKLYLKGHCKYLSYMILIFIEFFDVD